MNRLRSESGMALVVTLAIAGLLLPVGAWMLLQTRADMLIARNLRGELETFYVAEAGIGHALAQIEADGSFDRLLAGPAAGISPFAVAPPAFPEAPLRYEVVAAPLSVNTLSLISTGFGRSGAMKRIEALVWRDDSARLHVRWLEDD